MTRTLRYDVLIDAYVIAGEGALETEEDVARWKRKLFAQLEEIGRKIYLLVDLAGFKISPSVAALYGEIPKEVAERFALGVIRYNSTAERATTATVQIEAVANRFPSNIYPDRASAEKALEEIRGLPSHD